MSRKKLPKISIVTCSYQQGPFLESTLRSVLDQKYSNLEYIVMDGGSTDNSVDVLKKYSNQLAYWTSQKDKGQTDALIKGFNRSKGEILGWLCSDDLLLPGALQAIGEFFDKNPDVQAVYGDSLWIDAEGKFLRPKKEMPFSRFVFLYDHNYIPQPSMFWRRSLYKNCGGLDTSFNLAMDSDLWERFSAKTRIAYIPQYLSCMRYYPEQKTRMFKSDGRREDAIIRHRRAPHGNTQAIYPALHLMARAGRVVMKTLSGGYGSPHVPAEHLQWVQQHQIQSGV